MKTLSVLAAALVFLALDAHAAGGRVDQLLTQGAGIASPSMVTAIEENPAGLVFNRSPRLTGLARSVGPSLNPLTFGGVFSTGNGMHGLGIGYLQRSSSPTSRTALLGLATKFATLNSSIGVNGYYSFDAGHANDFSLGSITMLKPTLNLGLKAIGLKNGPDGYGAGFVYIVSPGASFAVDATVNHEFKGLGVKPSLKISEQALSLMVGYGFQASNTAPLTAMREELSVGLAYDANSFDLQYYYQQLDRHYVGIGFNL